MDELKIELRDSKSVYPPGGMVRGGVRWNLQSNPESLELSLLWYTSGKGTQDAGVVETLKWETPGASGSKDFSFVLPSGPYSFSGTLISLIWALELTVFPGSQTRRVELIVSPTGDEILLKKK
jgi:hypothetical protein